MIQYPKFKFAFAAPPRTATTWFLKACSDLEIGHGTKTNLHIPPPEGWDGYLISLVRHPYDWLASYYLALEGGVIGVQCVDTFAIYARTCMHGCLYMKGGVYNFIKTCVNDRPGKIGEMFDAYRASTVIKMEDLPWAAVEFFASLGIKRRKLKVIQNMNPQNSRKGHPHIPDEKLRKSVVRSERDFCERYEYY